MMKKEGLALRRANPSLRVYPLMILGIIMWF
jgi:hypothetical protein